MASLFGTPVLAEMPTQEVVEEKQELTTECYGHILEKYDWDIEVAKRIMKAESSCIPTAKNDNPNTGDYSIGLMQINLYGNMKNERPSEEDLLDPEKNIAYAYELYKSNRSWNHWTTY